MQEDFLVEESITYAGKNVYSYYCYSPITLLTLSYQPYPHA